LADADKRRRGASAIEFSDVMVRKHPEIKKRLANVTALDRAG
jgi:hypothetical protein